MTKKERLQVALTEEETLRLKQLADENTATNRSYLIRQLLEMAWDNPERFGLRVPKAFALAL